MTPTLILAGLVLVPAAVLTVIRSSAALVFLSLCLGDILVQFVGPDAHTFMQLFTAHSGKALTASDSTIKLFLLLLPAVLTAIFMIGTIKKGPKLILNALPALGTGLLLAFLVVPLLTPATAITITTNSLWIKLAQAQDLVVSASAFICLFTIWTQRPKHSNSEEKHGKHHKG